MEKEHIYAQNVQNFRAHLQRVQKAMERVHINNPQCVFNLDK